MGTQKPRDTLEAGTGFMSGPAEILKTLERGGYSENIVPHFDHFEARSGALKLYPENFEVDELIRYESTSDPDDQAVIYAISSREHQLKGAYVEAYGIYQDELSGRMLKKLKQRLH